MEEQPKPAAPSLGKVISNVFVSPSEVLGEIKDSASSSILWVVPLIATFIIVVLSTITIFTNEALKSEMIEMQNKTFSKMVSEGKMTQEQAEQA